VIGSGCRFGRFARTTRHPGVDPQPQSRQPAAIDGPMNLDSTNESQIGADDRRFRRSPRKNWIHPSGETLGSLQRSQGQESMCP
jgi:hypothetical protein